MNVRIGVLTISDRASQRVIEDTGGAAVEQALRRSGWAVVERAIVPDEQDRIALVLSQWSDDLTLDVIFTTGGTGLGPRDVTPEATLQVAERQVPGIAEAMRTAGLAATPFSMISRGVAVLRGHTLIINLPGNPKGAVEGVEVVRPVLEHAVAIVAGGNH